MQHVCCQDTFNARLILELQPNQEHGELRCCGVPTSSSSVNQDAKPVAMGVCVLEGGHGAVPAACEVQAMV